MKAEFVIKGGYKVDFEGSKTRKIRYLLGFKPIILDKTVYSGDNPVHITHVNAVYIHCL